MRTEKGAMLYDNIGAANTSRQLQRKQREDLLNKEGTPVRIKASDKGGTVTVGFISSTPGHGLQVAGLETLPLISCGLR